jgi:hypothetical protein
VEECDDPTCSCHQLAWMEKMERAEREVFPDARPRSEVVVYVMPTTVRFTEDDRYGLWRKGDLATDLGPEADDLPQLRLLRLHEGGETITLTRPYERGLIELVRESLEGGTTESPEAL